MFLNMLVTSLVMLAAFGIVYITSYNNTQTEINEKLNDAAGAFSVSGGIIMSGDNSTESSVVFGLDVAAPHMTFPGYMPSFVIMADKDGNIVQVNSFIDSSVISLNMYEEAVKTVMNQTDPSDINIAQRIWAYRIAPLQVASTAGGHAFQQDFDDFYKISFLDITDFKNNLNNLALILLLVGVGMLAVIFVISVFYAKHSIRPIAESWEKQKQFVADASHELKTPLTTIMANCDVLEANENDMIRNQKEWLDYIKIGAGRMNGLVNSLLTLARVEGMSVQAEKRHFDVEALIQDVIHSMDAAVAAKNLRVKQSFEFIGSICGYEDSIRQIFSILFENAIKYAGEGGCISVSLCRAKKDIVCTVNNTGKGIPAKDLPHVFDRFYRSDAARSNDEGGYGLGLSIAKSIAEQIGGKLAARSRENEWAEFLLSFEA